MATARPWVHPRVRAPSFVMRVVVIGVLMLVGAHAFATRYQVGFSDEAIQSLAYSWFLIDTQERDIQRGEYAVFHIDRDLPPWKKGARFVKRVVGIAGDHVVVANTSTTVNGILVAGNLDLIEALQQPAAAFTRAEVLAPNTMFVVGEMPRSYDSRYWGVVHSHQIVGRGIPLW